MSSSERVRQLGLVVVVELLQRPPRRPSLRAEGPQRVPGHRGHPRGVHALARDGAEHVEKEIRALQSLATAVRRLWGKTVVGVTGSTGKTTTKEAIAHVLSARYRVLKSEGNLNNHFGVPLQLLRLEAEQGIAVMAGPGNLVAIERGGVGLAEEGVLEADEGRVLEGPGDAAGDRG